MSKTLARDVEYQRRALEVVFDHYTHHDTGPTAAEVAAGVGVSEDVALALLGRITARGWVSSAPSVARSLRVTRDGLRLLDADRLNGWADQLIALAQHCAALADERVGAAPSAAAPTVRHADAQRIGRAIVRARREAGMTQRELATRIDVWLRTLRRWEEGRQRPSRLMRLRLVEALPSLGTTLDVHERESVGPFSDRLFITRRKARMGRNELGRRVGVTGAAVNFWESGQYLPGERETVERIEAVLDVNLVDVWVSQQASREVA